MDQQSSYSDLVSKPVQWSVEPETVIGQQKKEMKYIFWFEFLGTFLLTFSIISSKQDYILKSNNPFVVSCTYGVLLLMAQNTKCTFNPAITSILAITDKGAWVNVAIGSQFLGAFVAGLVGLATFAGNMDALPYIVTTSLRNFPAITIGETLGSTILALGFLFQYDQLLEYTNDRIEGAFVIAVFYGVGRILSYVAQSSLNPAIALSLTFFESIRDGEWSRFWLSWIFVGLPFIGAFIALTFAHTAYKNAYAENKLGRS